MGDLVLNCPLCCDKTFECKQELAEHLSHVLSELCCPICKYKVDSLNDLIQHINLENCQPSNEIETIYSIDDNPENFVHIQNVNSKLNDPENECLLSEDYTIQNNELDMNKMYVEILSKPMMKPLQTQEVKGNGDNQYIIITQDPLANENAIVTKRNTDGTISLTTVKELKAESDTLITQVENEPEDELYSCNTCGVSFSSVIDHIQNYHNDQDVVVEEPLDPSNDTAPAIEYEPEPSEQSPPPLEEHERPQRVITDSGDIIEAPVNESVRYQCSQCTASYNSSKALSAHMKVHKLKSDVNATVVPVKEEVVDQQGRVYTRKYVQIDKFCDSVVKDIKQGKNGPNHKVVVKELVTPSGEKMKLHNCLICNVYVASLEDFQSHPCNKSRYQCPHCTLSYDNSKSLCAHMKIHKLKSDVQMQVTHPGINFECEICSTKFSSNKSLKLHKRMHDNIKSVNNMVKIRLEKLLKEDTNSDKFLCSVCDKMIPTNYKRVHEASHEHNEKINCDICNKKFHSKEYLEMHMAVHNVDKVKPVKIEKSLPYTCVYCNRQFARPHEKVKHERIHTGEKPHSCEICGKSFRVSYCLTLHMRTHTGARPYACPLCGKRFKAHSVYNHHLLTHSDVRAYKCPYCPKAFKTAVQLAGHKNSHTKPFSCQHCNRPFASLYAVRVHTETHARQNNLKFSCSLCGASYARAFALRDHIKQVHKQDYVGTVGFREEDFMIKDNTEPEKELPTDIKMLGIASN